MRLIRKLTLKEATDDLLNDYKANGRRSLPEVPRKIEPARISAPHVGLLVRQPKLANQARRPAQPKLTRWCHA
jgi:hypothetical protein